MPLSHDVIAILNFLSCRSLTEPSCTPPPRWAGPRRRTSARRCTATSPPTTRPASCVRWSISSLGFLHILFKLFFMELLPTPVHFWWNDTSLICPTPVHCHASTLRCSLDRASPIPTSDTVHMDVSRILWVWKYFRILLKNISNKQSWNQEWLWLVRGVSLSRGRVDWIRGGVRGEYECEYEYEYECEYEY